VGEGSTCVLTGTHPPAGSEVSDSDARLNIKHEIQSNSLHKLQITFRSTFDNGNSNRGATTNGNVKYPHSHPRLSEWRTTLHSTLWLVTNTEHSLNTSPQTGLPLRVACLAWLGFASPASPGFANYCGAFRSSLLGSTANTTRAAAPSTRLTGPYISPSFSSTLGVSRYQTGQLIRIVFSSSQGRST